MERALKLIFIEMQDKEQGEEVLEVRGSGEGDACGEVEAGEVDG